MPDMTRGKLKFNTQWLSLPNMYFMAHECVRSVYSLLALDPHYLNLFTNFEFGLGAVKKNYNIYCIFLNNSNFISSIL